MFKKNWTKVLSKSDTAVKDGARKVQKGERGPTVDAFARRGRDQQDRKK